MSLVYLNGEYMPLAEASVSVLDRGFTFADGVYEVIPVFNRKVFRFEQHIQRLENSLAAIFMENPCSIDTWFGIFKKLISSVEQTEQSIYLQITRGVTERDHDISFADNPTVFAMSRPIAKKDLSAGISAITHEDIRWNRCDIKAIALLPSVLLRHEAKQKGAKEAILIRDGYVTEGAASNVFICKDGQILTPPKDNHVLPGITRDLLVEILEQHKLSYSEESISQDALFNADEIWITSSTWEIVPVTKLDEQIVGNGEAGSIWYKVNQLYQEFKSGYCH